MPQDQFNLAQDDDKLADYKNRKEAFKKLPSSVKTSLTKKANPINFLLISFPYQSLNQLSITTKNKGNFNFFCMKC